MDKKIEPTNVFQYFMVVFITPLVNLGNKIQNLKIKDIPEVQDEYNYAYIMDEFTKYLKLQKEKYNNITITRILCKYLFKNWIAMCLLFLFANILNILFPIFLRRLLNWLNEPIIHDNYGILYACIIALNSFVRVLITNFGMYNGHINSTKITVLFSVIISQKLIRLNNNSRKNVNPGIITTLLTVDVLRVVFSNMTLHQLFVSPILIVVYTILIADLIGVYALITPGIIIFFLVILFICVFPINNLSRKKMQYSDVRGKKINETMQGIKIIKMNTWEKIIKQKMFDIRVKEKIVIFLINFIKIMQDGIIILIPIVISFVTISAYIYNGNNLDIGDIFYLITLFSLIVSPLKVMLFALLNIFEALIALERLNNFNNLEEDGLKKIQNNNENNKLNKGYIQLKGNFSYNIISENNSNYELNDINITVQPGEFIGIIGTVGAGKSTVIETLLKEINKENNSKIIIKGTKSYIPQESFLINDTVRNNIIFGSEYNEEWYHKVLQLSELITDINLLPGGDLTEIGERGINLSGGQKQRVSIARALYQKSDIYLVDDCISALDAEVGKKIFNNLFLNELKANKKTIIMVTHALQFCNKMDKILLLEKGKVEGFGTYQELIENNSNFRELITNNVKSDSDKETEENLIIDNIKPEINTNKIENNPVNDIKKGVLTKKEKINQGVVKGNIYYTYFKSGTIILFIINIIFFILFVVLKIFGDYWISNWSINKWKLSNNDYLKYYGLITLVAFIVKIISSALFAYYTSIISFKLFQELINKLLQKRSSFFDTTPIGQILNLTSKDIDFIDLNIPNTLGQFSSQFFILLGTIVLICITNVFMIILFVILIIVLAIFLKQYLNISIQLRRLSQIAYSPVISNIVELINGMKTFKVYKKIDYQINKFNKNMHDLIKITFLERIVSVWIVFRLELMVTLQLAILLLLVVLAKYYRLKVFEKNLSIIGISLTYSINISAYIQFMLFMFSEVVKGMSSVERVKENVTNDNLETDWEHPNPPKEWPVNNTISIKDLNVKYRKGLEYVLKNLNFEIKQNEKIGLVGRTGSGKSSFILSLMRMIDNEGIISIDNIDISTLGLHHSRGILRLIPQDPFIIEGTLKDNIDPVGHYSESEITDVLNQVFENEIDKFKGDNADSILKFKIEAGGKNISIGQRQLICICRVMLGNPKILLMDEATSNIDLELDKKIQNIIKNKFKNSTIITIAHRLNTIINYDKIVVLSKGEIVEIGSPSDLLTNENSEFCKLVKENGNEFYSKMKEILNIN